MQFTPVQVYGGTNKIDLHPISFELQICQELNVRTLDPILSPLEFNERIFIIEFESKFNVSICEKSELNRYSSFWHISAKCINLKSR